MQPKQSCLYMFLIVFILVFLFGFCFVESVATLAGSLAPNLLRRKSRYAVHRLGGFSSLGCSHSSEQVLEESAFGCDLSTLCRISRWLYQLQLYHVASSHVILTLLTCGLLLLPKRQREWALPCTPKERNSRPRSRLELDTMS